MKFRSKNYYGYIFKNLLLLSGIFIFLLSLLFYFSYLNFARNTYLRSLQNTSKQSAELIDNCIKQSNNLSYILSQDKSTKEYINDSDNISKKIEATRFLTSGLLFRGDIAVILPEQNSVIANSSSMTLNFYLNSIGLSPEDFQTATEQFSSHSYMSPAVLFPSKTATTMIVLHKIATVPNPCIVSSVFNLSSLLPKSETTGNFCIRNKTELLNTIGPLDLDVVEKAASGHGFKYRTLNETSSPISFFGGNECFYVVPTSEYIKLSHTFAMTLLLIILSSALITLIFAAFVSTKIYHPILNLVDSISGGENAVSDELEYISENFTKLSDKNKVLFDLVASHSKQASDIFFIRMLNSSLSDDEIESGIEEYNYSCFSMPLVAFVVKITNYDAFNGLLDASGMHALHNNVMDAFETEFSEKEFKILSINNERFAGVVSAASLPKLKQRLIHCTSGIEMSLQAKLRVYVGDTVSSWHDLFSSYSSALNILDNYYFTPSYASVILPSDVSENEGHIFYPASLDSELLQSILHSQKNKTKSLVDEIVDNNYKTKVLKASLHSQLVMMMVSSLTKVFMTLNKSPEEVLPEEDNFYSSLIRYTNPEDLKNEFLRIAYRISDYTDSLNETINQRITQSMLSYIAEKYAESISLFSLSAYINMSQSHTSRLFKQLTGENFKDYLAKYRIAKAKELLDKNPSMKIKDLAVAVGYSSSDILNKVFMRYEGYLPSKYIKL